MLRQFHYIDPNGKDQGINVRNRSKELTDLLSDVDRIRTERKKARANKKKYGGVEGGASLGGGGMSGSSSSRYGGFGSESPAGYGGATRTVYGDGGGFGGEEEDHNEASRASSGTRERFDDYDEYDEGAVAAAAPSRRKAEATRTSTANRAPPKKAEAPKPKEPEIDLFDFGDDEPTAPAIAPVSASASNGKAPAYSANDHFGALQSGGADDDDFDDFQSATPAAAPAPSSAPMTQTLAKPNYSSLPPPISTAGSNISTQYAAPQPRQPNQDAFSNIFSTTSPITSTTSTPAPGFASLASPPLQHAPRPSGYQAAQPNYFTSVAAQPAGAGVKPASVIGSPAVKSPIGSSAPKPAAGGDAFASLLGGISKRTSTPAGGARGLTMADMAKQKASAGIWGAAGTSSAPSTPGAAPAQGHKTGGAMDDLLG